MKCGTVGIALASCLFSLSGKLDFCYMSMFIFFTFNIFSTLESISDSAHVLSVISDAVEQLNALKENNMIESDGRAIPLEHFDICFDNVDFSYDTRKIPKDVSFRILEKTSTAIVGPSGLGKITTCSLLAQFYDVNSGSISIGGTDIREMTCDNLLGNILFDGKDIPYVATNYVIEMAAMYGFVKNQHGVVAILNRIFEPVLYNHLLSEKVLNSEVYGLALANKLEFTQGRHLDMRRILEGFVRAYTEVSQGKDERFLEEQGRKYFMLYLKPIINGTGHSYVEARTRNLKRTDLVVDYLGEQFVIEMKIWNGPKYNSKGEKQIIEYLNYYGLKKDYMLTFNFNKQKGVGVGEIQYGDYTLVEAVV